MSAMKEAFRRAGHTSSDERLSEVALKAMVKHATDTEACIEAIWQTIRKDAALMATLFNAERRRAIGGLLNRVRNDIAYRQSNDELKTPTEKRAGLVVTEFRAKERREFLAIQRAEREQQSKADYEYQQHLAAWHATPIGNMEIGGTPIWQLTAGTVRGWLGAQQRKHRTVELLIEGLPEDDRPIEYYRKPEEVAALWKAAGIAS